VTQKSRSCSAGFLGLKVVGYQPGRRGWAWRIHSKLTWKASVPWQRIPSTGLLTTPHQSKRGHREPKLAYHHFWLIPRWLIHHGKVRRGLTGLSWRLALPSSHQWFLNEEMCVPGISSQYTFSSELRILFTLGPGAHVSSPVQLLGTPLKHSYWLQACKLKLYPSPFPPCHGETDNMIPRHSCSKGCKWKSLVHKQLWNPVGQALGGLSPLPARKWLPLAPDCCFSPLKSLFYYMKDSRAL
jgi:hypothetical protein